MDGNRAGARGLVRRWVGPAAFFVLATLVMTWPVGRHLTDHLVVPGDFIGRGLLPTSPDTYLHLYILAWVAHVMPSAPGALFDAPMMYPAARALAGSEHMLAHWPLHAPVYAVSGNPVLAYQWVLVSAFVLNGLALFVLARRWTGSTAAALVGGTVYAFFPLRFELIGTVQHLNVAYLPLLVLGVERWRERGRTADLALVALATAMQTLCSYYLAYATVVALAIVGAAVWLAGPRAARGGVGALVLAAGVGLLPVALLAWPYLALRAAALVPEYPERWLRAASATPGWFVRRDAPLFIGWGVLTLALVGLAAGRRSVRGWMAAALALAGAGLALGPTLDLFGLGLPLPYRVLYDWVPGFSSLRYPYRFGVLTALGVALLASLGWGRVVEGRRWAWPATVLLLAVVAGEYWKAPLALVGVETGRDLPPAYAWLRAHGAGRPLLEAPVAPPGDLRAGYQQSRAMYFGTYHWLPLVNGYTAYEPPSHHLVSLLAERLPDARAFGDLVDLTGVRLLLLHRDRLDPKARGRWESWLASGACEPLAEFGPDVVCGLAPQRADLRPRLVAANERPPTESFRGIPLAPLPEAGRQGRLTAEPPGHALVGGLVARLRVGVENRSDAPWPGLAPVVPGVVAVRHRWRPDQPWVTTPLLCDLAPGDSCALVLPVVVPSTPGTHELEVALTQEGGTDLEVKPLRLPIRVVTLGRRPAAP